MQKKIFGQKQIALLVCIVILSAASVAYLSGPSYAESFQEVWLKLWQKNGNVVDIRFQIRSIGSSHLSADIAVPLTVYPFQFDISDLGNIPETHVKGIVYGSRILSNSRPGTPLQLRWWVVRQNLTDAGNPSAARYPLTLKLRVFDADGNEFNQRYQQAALLKKDSVFKISKVD